MISNKEIDRLAIESYERLTNGSNDPNTNLFYRHGFEAGFKKAQEFELFAREMATASTSAASASESFNTINKE